MRVRQLSPTGDFTFGRSSGNYIANTPATVGQCVLTALRLIQGEWFMDSTAGVPYGARVLGPRTVNTRDAVIRAAILGVQGVTEITSYSSQVSGRSFSLAATINTLYGVTQVSL